MAKRKNPAPDAIAPPPPDPEVEAPAKTILTMKGRKPWDQWLTMVAAEARTDRVGFLDRAAAELAEKLGLPKPPPRL